MSAEPTNRHDDRTPAVDVNQSVANLLERMARELEEHGAVDVEALARANPQHADRLRQLLPAMEAVAGWAERTTSFSGETRTAADVPQLGDAVQYFGDYVLLEEIARGGMGVVYKARQTTLNRVVALKMILTGELASEREVERFHAEAQAAARLDHPGIVPIFEVGQHQGRHYFSMGYVEGASLAERIKDGPLNPREAAELIRKVTQAVAYAHEQGVVHRDLKPANVLLDRGNEPRVTDFGLAKQVRGDSNLTATGQILGTPAFMPPEQAGGAVERIDQRSDVYSLGAMLYCLVTGRPPFQAASPVDTLLQVLSAEAVAPRTLNPAVPADLETICLKCLEKDPKRRYQSATEVGDELGRFLENRPIQARPVGQVERAWRWCKRNRTVAALTAAVASLLIAIAVAGPLAAWRQSALRLEAEQASELERQQREKAEQLREANRQQLVKVNLRHSDVLVENNDPIGAMPWYAEALRLDEGNADREALHRQRLNTIWQSVPRFIHLWRHAAGVSRVAISRDERYIATASDDHTARVWNLETGKPVTLPLMHTGLVRDCAFSRDGKQLITAGGLIGISGEIRLWDIATGKPVGQPVVQPQDTFYQAGFTDNGDILAAGLPMTGNGHVQLRNPSTGSIIATKRFDPLSPEHVMNSLTRPWSLSAARVLERDKSVGRVFDLAASARKICEVKQESQLLSAAFSSDGSRMLTTTWHSFYVWDAATGRELARYNGEPNGWDVYDFAGARVQFSLDNQRITIAGANGRIMTFDTRTGASTNARPFPNVREARPFTSNDGRFVAVATRGGRVLIWDVWAQKPIAPLLRHSSSVADALFADNNRLVVIGCSDGSVRVWDLSSAVGIPGRQFVQDIERNEYSSDGKEHVVISRTTVTRSDDAAGKQLSEFKNPGPWPTVTATSVEHHLYAAGCSGGIARVWDYVTAKPVSPELKHERKEFSHIAISPNGKLLLTIDVNSFNVPDNYFGQANVWQIETGKRILGPIQFSNFVSATTCAALSPDSRLLAVGGGSVSLSGIQPELKLFDLETGREVEQSFDRSPNVFIGKVAFDPHGRYLASITGNPFVAGGQLRIWDLKQRRTVGSVLKFADNPTDLRFDAPSRFIAVPVDNQVHVLLLESGKLALPPLVHDQTVNGIEFSADATRILTSAIDNTVRVWDVATGCRVGPNYPHPNVVRQMRITPGGMLITTCADNWIRYRYFTSSDRPTSEILQMVRSLSAEDFAMSPNAPAPSLDLIAADWESMHEKSPTNFESSAFQRSIWHDIHATDCWNRADWLAAIPGYEQMEKLGSCNHLNFGRVLCQTGQFGRGTEQFDKAVKANPDDSVPWAHAAAVRLHTGDLDGYQETCRKMYTHFANFNDPLDDSESAIICLIGPNDFKDGSSPFEMAARAMKHNVGPVETGKYIFAAALADYRAHRYLDALKELQNLIEKSNAEVRVSLSRYLHAMAMWQLEKKDEARKELADADKYCREHPIGDYAGTWFDRVLVGAISQEAKQLIVAEQPPAERKDEASADAPKN
jgi:serine/threonine protein kinase/WD40 repeat protein/tetratricopeptide (TPR) repeat protein